MCWYTLSKWLFSNQKNNVAIFLTAARCLVPIQTIFSLEMEDTFFYKSNFILFSMVSMYHINRTLFYVYIYCISFQKGSSQKIMLSTSLQLSIITIYPYFLPVVIIFLSLYCYNSEQDYYSFITIHTTIYYVNI